jgi:hypothetical protein
MSPCLVFSSSLGFSDAVKSTSRGRFICSDQTPLAKNYYLIQPCRCQSMIPVHGVALNLQRANARDLETIAHLRPPRSDPRNLPKAHPGDHINITATMTAGPERRRGSHPENTMRKIAIPIQDQNRPKNTTTTKAMRIPRKGSNRPGNTMMIGGRRA